MLAKSGFEHIPQPIWILYIALKVTCFTQGLGQPPFRNLALFIGVGKAICGDFFYMLDVPLWCIHVYKELAHRSGNPHKERFHPPKGMSFSDLRIRHATYCPGCESDLGAKKCDVTPRKVRFF